MLGDASLQTDAPLHDMAKVFVYQGTDGRMWVRPVQEFEARFKRLKSAPAQRPEEFTLEQEPQRLSDARIREVLIPIFMRQDQASIHWPDIFEEVRAIEAAICPPGHVVVPLELTPAMWDAACPQGEIVDHFDMPTAYRAMIAVGAKP